MNAHFQQTPVPPGQWVPGSWGTSGSAVIQQAPAIDPSVASWQSQPGPNPAITGAAWMQHQQGKGQYAMTSQSLASGPAFGALSWEQALSQGSVDAFSAEDAGKGVSAHHFNQLLQAHGSLKVFRVPAADVDAVLSPLAGQLVLISVLSVAAGNFGQ